MMQCNMDDLSDVLTRSFLDLCKDKLQYRAWFKVKGSLEVTVDGEHVLLLNICETIISDCQRHSSRAKEAKARNPWSDVTVSAVLQGAASELHSKQIKEETVSGVKDDAYVVPADAHRLHRETAACDTQDLTGYIDPQASQKLDVTLSCSAVPHFTPFTVPVRNHFGVAGALTGSCDVMQTESQRSCSSDMHPSLVMTDSGSDLPLTCILHQDNHENSLNEQSSVLHAPNASQTASCQSSSETNLEVRLRPNSEIKTTAKTKLTDSFSDASKLNRINLCDIKIEKELPNFSHCEDIAQFRDEEFAPNNFTEVKSETVVAEQQNTADAKTECVERGGQLIQISVPRSCKQKSVQLEQSEGVTLTPDTNTGKTSKACERSKTNSKNFICSLCGKVFQEFAAYKRHTHNAHRKFRKRHKRKNSVATDDEKNSTIVTVQNFAQSDSGKIPDGKKHKCPNCSKQFVQLKRLEKHMKDYHAAQEQKIVKAENEDIDPQNIVNQGNDDKKTCKCPSCGKDFRDLESLEKHKKTAHGKAGKKRHVCEKCGKVFEKRRNCSKHMRTHSNERPYKCEFCVKTFKYAGGLRIHRKLHTGEKPWKCDVCGKCFVRSGGLSAHMRVHSEQKRVHICTVCNKGFTTKEILKQHSHIHMDDDRYKCDICGISFTNVAAHRLTHTGEKNYVCTVCGRGFTQFGNLKSHLRTHTGEKPYACPQCDLKFARKGSLTSHLKLHSGEKNYVCSICGKAFSQSSSLKYHIRVHEGIKPHVCSVCNKAYVDPCNLRVHMRIHTGEKPYICEFCGKAFNQSISLKIHRRIHTGEKPYTCDLCGASFSQLAGLKSHKLTHQGDRRIDKT